MTNELNRRPNSEHAILDAVINAWERHNTVMINLLSLIPVDSLAAKITPQSKSVSEMYMHLHHERMVSVAEEAPEIHPLIPTSEWIFEPDPNRIRALLQTSVQAVIDAVRARVKAGKGLERSFAHPIQLIQFLIFHEGYHHGQMKSALKIYGTPVSDQDAGPMIWDVWRSKG